MEIREKLALLRYQDNGEILSFYLASQRTAQSMGKGSPRIRMPGSPLVSLHLDCHFYRGGRRQPEHGGQVSEAGPYH